MNEFLVAFSIYETNWKQNLSLVLPQIRASKMADSKMVRLITDYTNSPFSKAPTQLELAFHQKMIEITKILSNAKIIKSQDKKLISCIQY